ncbi:putative bifunctional diguanylate cyclase/phosphodiesterase [Kineococcus sp. SYSU DK004]|uniref:putative bifunctional diguanylate cyclase/phosphodiesterase n=1 Tax=Kineococcus sp. SYSU DK004 TaxID=3383125 RepID=UPI003D7E2DDA
MDPEDLWRPAGAATPPEVATALLHLASAQPHPVLVVSRPAEPAPREAPRVRWANAAAAELLAVAADALPELALTRVLRPAAPGAALTEHLLRERHTRFAATAITSSGEARACELVAWPVPAAPAPPGAPGTGAEECWVLQGALPGDARADAALRAAEERFATLARSSPVATIVSDVGARLSHVNDAFAALTGRSAAELHGTGWLACVVEEERAAVVEAVTRVLAGRPVTLDTRLRTATGQVRWVHVRFAPSRTPGYGAGFIATVEDVTDRLAREHRLAYQAQHDLLTGLPNRLALLEHLAGLLPAAGEGRGGGARAGVLMVDLDDFKTVNDGLGPEAGDAVLVEVARRLAGTVRAGDLVTRPGGDEFVVVCHDLPDADAVAAAARRVLDTVSAPVEVNGLRLDVVASVGVVLLGGPSGTPDELLRDAGIATHEAKAAGGGRWALLDDEVRRRARRALRLVADLREALARGTVDVHYQPIVRPGPVAEVLSVEALCRWRHPELGPVDPGTFVPLAERAGLVPALDAHVLAVACRDLAGWRAAERSGELPRAPRWVAVNVSAVTLSAEGFADSVRRTAAAAGVQLSDLCLEVTETALASDLRACREVLEELRRDGARVAVDDFGTGYSSLAYLKDLPVDHLKVDRSFVRDLDARPRPRPGAVPGARPGDQRGGPARAVAAAVVSLARTLGLGVVAEGVETPEQDAVLAELGCEAVQGYLYSRPLEPAALLALLRSGGRVERPAAVPAPRTVTA